MGHVQLDGKLKYQYHFTGCNQMVNLVILCLQTRFKNYSFLVIGFYFEM
jgi:hypothetical protein